MKIPKEKLEYLQDEEITPYEENERPIPFTKEMEDRERQFIKSLGFSFKDDDLFFEPDKE